MEAMVDQLPKDLRQKVKYLMKLTKEGNIFKLRELRSASQNILIDIYHHSAGTDSFFSDIDKKYLTWAELVKRSNDLMANGETLFTGVIEYKAGIHFVSGITSPDPLMN